MLLTSLVPGPTEKSYIDPFISFYFFLCYRFNVNALVLMLSSDNPLGFHAMIVSVSPVGILKILEVC